MKDRKPISKASIVGGILGVLLFPGLFILIDWINSEDPYEGTYGELPEDHCEQSEPVASEEIFEPALEAGYHWGSAGNTSFGCEWSSDDSENRVKIHVSILVREGTVDVGDVREDLHDPFELPYDSDENADLLPAAEQTGDVEDLENPHVWWQRGYSDTQDVVDEEGTGQLNRIDLVDDNLHVKVEARFTDAYIPEGSSEQQVREELVEFTMELFDNVPRT